MRNQVCRPGEFPTCHCGAATEHWWGETRLMFAPPMGAHDNPGYWDVVTDQFVDSKRTRRNIMAEYELIEAGDKKPFSERMKEHDGKPPGGAGSRDL